MTCSQSQKESSSLQVSKCMQTYTQVYCFANLLLEHAYSNTQGCLANNDMIGAIFAIAPKKYRAMLKITAENQGAALQPSRLEAVMRKLWRQSGGNKGLRTATMG